MSTDLFSSLTDAQSAAVAHIDGPLLVLAGPGSGKTRVVTFRIANILRHDIAARQILALTFTNKAAEEMQARLNRLVPGEPVWMGTFHRFCSRLLRQYAAYVGLDENFTIYDTNDSRKVVQRVMEECERELTHTTPQAIAAAISNLKNRLVTAEKFRRRSGVPLDAILETVYPLYQKRLQASNAADFDDLLLYAARLLRENSELRATLDDRYRYVLVDEYQDTNLAQYAIVRALCIDHRNLAVTGDPDQSIYGWRGANLNNILDFEGDFPDATVVRLEQNYRSTKRILRVADALISNNTRRKVKTLFTDNAEGTPVRIIRYGTQRDEADSIATRIASEVDSGRRKPSDFAVFYRINALSRNLELALHEQGIPYQVVNGLEFYQRKEIKDVVAYLHLVNNSRDDVAFARIVNCPPRGIGRNTIKKLTAHAVRHDLSLLDAARDADAIESLNRRSATVVGRFVTIMNRLSSVATAPVEEIMGNILTESRYREHLQESDDPADQDRLANILELLTAAKQFDESHPGDGQLDAFLEQASLVADTDALDGRADQVTLMTMHAAKGLEFPVVFIIATEEGILPHERSSEDPAQLEEERRLLFVGITRAEEELELSRATRREFRGRSMQTVPSSFLMEIPRDETEAVSPDGKDFGDFDFTPDPEWDDEDWVGEESAPVTVSASATPRLKTAAEMLQDGRPTAAPPSPDAFHVGMFVSHPQYQMGRVVALSGTERKRTATVQFFTEPEPRKFRIANSPLVPVNEAPPGKSR